MKIKIPLKMADGTQARTTEELREHFDLASVLKYYDNGNLVDWLADRYYEEEARKVSALEPSSTDFKQQLCDILGVPYPQNEADDVNLREVSAKNKRLERLKRFTSDDEILEAVDCVAFSQEDIVELLTADRNIKRIYLCGERFALPEDYDKTEYIGVNHPTVYASVYLVEDLEDTVSMIRGAEMTSDQIEFEPDKLWFKLAEKGNAVAQNELANCYSSLENYEESFKWYLKSAKQGYNWAQLNLADCYYHGSGVEQNFEQAFFWYCQSAEQGVVDAQYKLAECYENGKGIEGNPEEAFRWYHRAADSGNAEAQYHTGLCYHTGEGVEQNHEESFKWFLKSAEQGYDWAQYRLGKSYYNGSGVERNYSSAAEWLHKAAIQGNAEAQYSLGLYYFNMDADQILSGIGTNYPEGCKWLHKSIEQGNVAALAYFLLVYYSDLFEDNMYMLNLFFPKAREQGRIFEVQQKIEKVRTALENSQEQAEIDMKNLITELLEKYL